MNPDPSTWSLRLVTNRELRGGKAVVSSTGRNQVELQLKNIQTGDNETFSEKYDLVVLATGYKRNPFASVLKPLESILEPGTSGAQFRVDRNYRLCLLAGKVRRDAGVWLQGCCESTHGVGALSQLYVIYC